MRRAVERPRRRPERRLRRHRVEQVAIQWHWRVGRPAVVRRSAVRLRCRRARRGEGEGSSEREEGDGEGGAASSRRGSSGGASSSSRAAACSRTAATTIAGCCRRAGGCSARRAHSHRPTSSTSRSNPSVPAPLGGPAARGSSGRPLARLRAVAVGRERERVAPGHRGTRQRVQAGWLVAAAVPRDRGAYGTAARSR